VISTRKKSSEEGKLRDLTKCHAENHREKKEKGLPFLAGGFEKKRNAHYREKGRRIQTNFSLWLSKNMEGRGDLKREERGYGDGRRASL